MLILHLLILLIYYTLLLGVTRKSNHQKKYVVGALVGTGLWILAVLLSATLIVDTSVLSDPEILNPTDFIRDQEAAVFKIVIYSFIIFHTLTPLIFRKFLSNKDKRKREGVEA